MSEVFGFDVASTFYRGLVLGVLWSVLFIAYGCVRDWRDWLAFVCVFAAQISGRYL